MTIEGQLRALRHSVALSELSHLVCLRVAGAGAFALLDRLCPAQLFLRDGRMLHTLLLSEDGRPFADLYIGRDDQDFLLLSEGPTVQGLSAHLMQHAPKGATFELQDLAQTHTLLGLNGPYAWELLAEHEGPQIVGLPYLEFARANGGGLTMRVGKTGEYGYCLVVPNAAVDTTRTRLLELGAKYELAIAGLEALDHCALENWFFNLRREGMADVTPLELQLRWRLSLNKKYVGSVAIEQRRCAGIKERLTYVVSPKPLAIGDRVRFGDQTIGRIANAGFSPERADWVALAFLQLPFAHSGLTLGGLRTVSPPGLNNLSLHVDPQRHSWRSRHETKFPPIVLERA